MLFAKALDKLDIIDSKLCGENHSYIVQYRSSHSSYFHIKAGVPQRSDLSPYLFNIYTAHMPVTTNTIIASYADDTVILLLAMMKD